MPQQRMDIRMIKDILRLKYQGGLSHECIAQSLAISKGAVAKYLSLAGAAGLDWATTAELDEGSLERRLMGGGAALSRVVEPDYARVHIELRRKGVTLMLLWAEYRAVTLPLIDVVHSHSITRLVLAGPRARFARTASG